MKKVINIFNYFSIIIIPIIFLYIFIIAIKEKINIFDNFIEGVKDGIKIIQKIFPTLLGLFLAIDIFNNSGLIYLIIYITNPIINLLKIPAEVLPLILLKPVSRKCIPSYWNRFNEKIWS